MTPPCSTSLTEGTRILVNLNLQLGTCSLPVLHTRVLQNSRPSGKRRRRRSVSRLTFPVYSDGPPTPTHRCRATSVGVLVSSAILLFVTSSFRPTEIGSSTQNQKTKISFIYRIIVNAFSCFFDTPKRIFVVSSKYSPSEFLWCG